MRNRLRQTIAALRGNRGSGMVVVVVTMLFVSLLGAALLYASYTSYLVRIADRENKRSFYDASTAMAQVTAGVQEKVSDAIANAYTYVLTNYSSLPDPKSAFELEFRNQLLTSDYTIAPVAAPPVVRDLIWRSPSPATDYYYSARGLRSFITPPAGAEVGINGSTDAEHGAEVRGDVAVQITPAKSTITLKNVSLTYRQNELETKITTDIAIDMPDFYQSAAEYAISGLPDYALIAKDALISGNEKEISGSAYAGAVRVSAGTLTMRSGALISPGAIALSAGGARFSAGAQGSVWARDILVGSGGTLTLNGKAYIADDLELHSNAEAIIGGDYYGFGMSETVADQSSAILSNGINARLNLANANKLFLAGNSFISGGAGIVMGESVSAKANQRIYLIPDTYLASGGAVTANPQIFSRAALLDAGGTAKDLTANVQLPPEIASEAVVRQLVYPLSGEQYAVYFFMQFTTVQQANAYFAQYFAAHQADIAPYLQKYLKISGKADLTQTHGNAIAQSGTGLELQLAAGADALQAVSNRLSRFYKNLCVNLTTTGSTASVSNPYDYYVSAEKMSALSGTDKGTVEAVDGTKYSWFVTKGDCTIDGGMLDEAGRPYSVIIAAGNVVVNTDFKGLILSGGTITMNANVTAGTFTDEVLHGLGEYLTGYASETTDAGTKERWNLDKLVYYHNWTKQ